MRAWLFKMINPLIFGLLFCFLQLQRYKKATNLLLGSVSFLFFLFVVRQTRVFDERIAGFYGCSVRYRCYGFSRRYWSVSVAFLVFNVLWCCLWMICFTLFFFCVFCLCVSGLTVCFVSCFVACASSLIDSTLCRSLVSIVLILGLFTVVCPLLSSLSDARAFLDFPLLLSRPAARGSRTVVSTWSYYSAHCYL